MSPRVKWLGSWHLSAGHEGKVCVWVRVDESIPRHGGRRVVVWMTKAEAEAHIRELQSIVANIGDQG